MPRKQNRFSRRSRKIGGLLPGGTTYCCSSFTDRPCTRSYTGSCALSSGKAAYTDDGSVIKYRCKTPQVGVLTDAVLKTKMPTDCVVVNGAEIHSGPSSVFGGKKKTRNHKSKKNKSKRAKK